METDQTIAGLEKLVEQIVDRKLPTMIGSRLTEELSRRAGADTSVFAALVASGDVFLKIEVAAAIADCHPKTIKRALEAGELTRYSAGEDPRIKLGELLGYLGRQASAETPEAVRARARALVRHGRRSNS
ncbi:MAG: hypothetical protein ABSF35_22025 [Polyangia bacterium]|jgi:hypothetical protein